MERLPENVHSVITLEQWAKKHGEAALAMKEADLLLSDETIDEADYPTSLTINGQKLRLEYHFDPGGAADGITVNIPLPALNALEARAFERLVPAMLPAKIEALLRALPKVWRRQLVPIPAFAQAVSERIAGDDAPLHAAIRAAIRAIKGTDIPEDAFDETKIDDHHRMNYRLLDAKKPADSGKPRPRRLAGAVQRQRRRPIPPPQPKPLRRRRSRARLAMGRTARPRNPAQRHHRLPRR